jgi:lipopolysaccharide export system protein LptA
MKKSFLKILYAILFCLQTQVICSKINPLSKIVITSKNAVCKKDNEQKNRFTFTYRDNVLLTFADSSTIQSDELEIEIDTSKNLSKTDFSATTTVKNSKKTQDDLSKFKKITFNKNLIVKSTNRLITADKAELYLAQKKCNLSGNIKIEQKKESAKDLPITTECDYAMLNLQTDRLTFLGQEQKPVCTTIILDGQPGLIKKSKTKKQKRAENKALKKHKVKSTA